MLSLLTLFLITYFSNAQNEESPSSTLAFSSQGKLLRQLNAEDLQKEAAAQSMTVYEPLEKVKKSYRGFLLLPMLQKIYGKRLPDMDILSVYCTDGYRADIPLSEFAKVKSLVAFAMTDGSPFKIREGKKIIPLGPYYLVWDHPDSQSTERNAYRWPYGVNKIDLINSKSAYAPLELKEVSADLKLGQQKFMQHCLSCHSINGVGGSRGPALDGFMATQETGFLIKYILDPQGMNKASQMSGLPKDLKNRDQIAAAIVYYAKNISKSNH